MSIEIVEAQNQFATFLNGKWRITESGTGSVPYDVEFNIDGNGNLRAFNHGSKPVGTCPKEAFSGQFPELAALCGDNSKAEQMNILNWQFDGTSFIFENNLYGIIEHFELNIVDNGKMQGRAYNHTPSLPAAGFTRNRGIQMIKVAQ